VTAEKPVPPEDRFYSKEHLWVKVEDSLGRVGITDYAQDELGDVMYVNLSRPGTRLSAMDKLGDIESVKVASELFSPVSGEIVEVNKALDDKPELINQDPYGEGWMVLMRLSQPSEVDSLLRPSAYADLVRLEQGP
jgi:glycine cleavage system H protein